MALFECLYFKLCRTQKHRMPATRMQPLAIIEDLDVLEYISSRFSPCSIIPTMNPLPLEPGEEAFYHGIIKQFPAPLMLQATPCSLRIRWKPALAY